MKLRAWQAEAYPLLVRAWQQGEPGLVRAATGSGKSILLGLLAARGIKLRSRHERIVISVPTQALVHQLQQTFHLLQARASVFYAEEKDLYHPIVIVCNHSLEALYHAMARRRLQASVWIADECHRTESPMMRAWAESWPHAWRLGFTATPHRATDKERLRLYNTLIYEYTAEQALADGVIVPPCILPYRGHQQNLDDACIEAILGEPQLRGLPGLVSAWHINDATQFAQKLSKAGCRAAPIHGKQPRRLRKRLLEALRQGSLACLVHVNLLTEGADLPWLRWLCMRRAAKDAQTSRNRFIQEVGRVLRTWRGKSEALILDPHDLFNRLQLTYAAVLGHDVEDETEDEQEESTSPPAREFHGGSGVVSLEDFSQRELPQALRERQELRGLAMKLRMDGMIAPRDGSLRRDGAPTKTQMAALGKALQGAKHAEREVSLAFRGMLARFAGEGVRAELTAGDLEDLLGVLGALGKGWRE